MYVLAFFTYTVVSIWWGVWLGVTLMGMEPNSEWYHEVAMGMMWIMSGSRILEE